jgi:hypothetical protein
MVGSTPIPFESITIEQVANKTYEPRLEEVLHRALSEAFIEQGIQVMTKGGAYTLKSTITEFKTLSEAEYQINKINRGSVVEQRVYMDVDFSLIGEKNPMELKKTRNPYKFTFGATGPIQTTVNRKAYDTQRVAREIALELITQIMMRNVQQRN